jgi:trk system potassium uptake protein TrkA
MRVIICGAGQVGYNIAAYLAKEDNDVTLIDQKPQLIAHVNDELDVSGIVGHASNPDILSEAGAAEADMLIAVTYADEVNMVACQVGHSLFNIPRKIARIRNQSYRDPAWVNLFSRANMPIDVIISPEMEVARAIEQRLRVPGTTNVDPLANGRVYMVGVICEESCPVLNTPINQLDTLFPDLSISIMAISRGNTTLVPDKDDQIFIGDEVYFAVDREHLYRAMSVFGHAEAKARRILVMGGGNIGLCLANMLREEYHDVRLKLIERMQDRAHELSEAMDEVVVINGDGLHREILEEANITNTETLVCVTDDDEANILGSLLGREFGCERVLALVNKNIYTPLTFSLGIDAMISPRDITVSKIMQHVRRGRIKAIHNILDGTAEIIEAEASQSSEIINVPIGQLKIPKDVVIGAIVRDGNVYIPGKHDIVRPKDHVIILAAHGQASRVEQLFSVQVDLV